MTETFGPRRIERRTCEEDLDKLPWQLVPLANEYRCQFMHRDGRVWAASVEQIRRGWQDNDLDPVRGRLGMWVLRCRSDNCREMAFLATVARDALAIGLNFANLPWLLYRRIVTDADETSTHATCGQSVVVVVKSLNLRDATTEDKTLTLLGRVKPDGDIELYPTRSELEEIAYKCCEDTGGAPLLSSIFGRLTVDTARSVFWMLGMAMEEAAAVAADKVIEQMVPARRGERFIDL
jgi:hypothetical protein